MVYWKDVVRIVLCLLAKYHAVLCLMAKYRRTSKSAITGTRQSTTNYTVYKASCVTKGTVNNHLVFCVTSYLKIRLAPYMLTLRSQQVDVRVKTTLLVDIYVYGYQTDPYSSYSDIFTREQPLHQQ